MAHEYKAQAKESHAKKIKAYGGDEKHTDKAKNFAGYDALNTNEQRGLKPINKEPELSKETAPRIMRKKGGKVVGATSLKRLDKAPRKGRQLGGDMTDPMEAMKSAERLRELRSEKREDEGPTREEAETINRKQRYSIEDLDARKKGGKVSEMEWEHSKADLNQDRKLAKKHGMSMEKWEKSKLDEKHDKQQSTEGLRKGGRAKREAGGALVDNSKKEPSKGKTTEIKMYFGVNPADGAAGIRPMSGMQPGQSGTPMMPPPPPPPPQMGAAPGAPPPGGMPPMGAPPMMPPPPPGGAPMPRKDGGKVQVPYKKPGRKGDYPAMDFGAGSGFGRKQKKDAYGEKPVPYNKDNY